MSDKTTPALTVVALAWREAAHLSACFKSVEPLKRLAGARTLVVLNSDADSCTTAVAQRVADRVVVSPFVNFSVQRNRGLDAAATEWVFFIDSDERCTSWLAREIVEAMGKEDYAAYRVPRRNILFGHEVRHTGWWPDHQTRLLFRERCRYDEARDVHEFPIVNGRTGTLTQPLIHYNYRSWRHFIEKQSAYAKLDAKALYRAGRRARPRSFIGQPLREFKRRYLDYEGYKDGPLGLALSIAMALYRLETQRRLRDLDDSSG